MSLTNIMIVGVGGQGTLLASKLLGKVFTESGNDVKVSEVHGMSQRGGSVVTYVRFGAKVFSPVIDKGEADIILAFELLEAARWAEYLKPGGRVIVNTQRIDPMPVITGAMEYPQELVSKLISTGANVDARDFLALAEAAGSARAVNVAMLGALSASFPAIPLTVWQEALNAIVPAKFLALNQKAFIAGRGETESPAIAK